MQETDPKAEELQQQKNALIFQLGLAHIDQAKVHGRINEIYRKLDKIQKELGPS